MFAVGVCVGSEERFTRCAKPGVERWADPDTTLLTRRGQRSICAAYNDMLKEARGVEGVVLMHEDVELRAPILPKLRALFDDPTVAVVGAIGGRGSKSLQWWVGERYGTVTDCHGPRDGIEGTHDVDSVDGLLLALSPWAVENLRFDERRFPRFHGYDADLCFQARHKGKRVVVTDLDIHHHNNPGFGDRRAFQKADLRFRQKWGHTSRLRVAGAYLAMAVGVYDRLTLG